MTAPSWLQPPPLRVLVADDNRDTVLTLTLLMQSEGHEVRWAYNGLDTMRIARLHRFDAIIVDIEMPEMSGYAVAQDLRTLYYATPAPLSLIPSERSTQYPPPDGQVTEEFEPTTNGDPSPIFPINAAWGASSRPGRLKAGSSSARPSGPVSRSGAPPNATTPLATK